MPAEGMVPRKRRLRINLSDCLRHLGRPGEAVASTREAALQSAGADSPLVQACDVRLADALLDTGEAEEAEAVARSVLRALEADADATPASRSDARLRLGVALATLGRAGEARAELEGGLAGTPGAQEWRRRAESALAGLAE